MDIGGESKPIRPEDQPKVVEPEIASPSVAEVNQSASEPLAPSPEKAEPISPATDQPKTDSPTPETKPAGDGHEFAIDLGATPKDNEALIEQENGFEEEVNQNNQL